MACCLHTVHWAIHFIKGRQVLWLVCFTVQYTRGTTFVTFCLLTFHLTLRFIQGRQIFVTSCLLTVHWTFHYIQRRQFLWLPVCLPFTEPFIMYKEDNFCDFLFAYRSLTPSLCKRKTTFVTCCSLNPSLYTRKTTFVTCCLLTVHLILRFIQGRQIFVTSCLLIVH